MKKICENRFEDFIPFNKENRNKRIYTKDSFIPEKFQEFQDEVKDRRVFGEFFPGAYSFSETSVSLNNSTHIIESIEKNEDGILVKIELIDNLDKKTILNEMRKTPERFVIRPRAIGKIEEDKLVKDAEMITFDVIPAHEDSFQDIL